MTLPSETLKQWREEAQNTIDNIGASYTGCDAEMEDGDALTIEDNRRIIALIDALEGSFTRDDLFELVGFANSYVLRRGMTDYDEIVNAFLDQRKKP